MASASNSMVYDNDKGNTLCHTIVCVVVTIVLQVLPILSQAQDIDFLKYKFYDDDYEETLQILKQDTIITPALSSAAFDVDDYNMRYALYNAGFKPRGYDSDAESYSIGGITLHYNAARRLLALGVARHTYDGLKASLHSGATLSHTHLVVGRERNKHSDKHRLRAEFSGRNYTAGITHDASWLISPNDVQLQGDWEINHNIRVRTGRDLYVEGVFTNAIDWAIEASRYTRRHSLSIATTLSYSNRGLRQASSEEAFSLLNDPLYNPIWGIQQGKVRNSRVRNTLRPDIIALWEYRLTAATTLHVTTNIGFESRGTTSLEWYDALTPIPDNYRYMPSYFTQEPQQLEVTKAWTQNDIRYTQVDWESLYHTNMLQSDGHARYSVAKRRENITNGALSAHITTSIADVDITAGLLLRHDSWRHFKVMNDLLGANHIIDLDYYLINDATFSNSLQNNLLAPNRKIGVGDRYGYDYRLNMFRCALFGTASWGYDDGDIDFGIAIASTTTHRRGFFEKELFPNEGSYGRSTKIKLLPYRISAHWQHVMNNHSFGASFMTRGESPDVEDMFLQRDYNNSIVRDLSLATTIALEARYGLIISSKLTLAATLFSTSTLNNISVLHYYDDLAGEFVDCVVSNIDTTVGGLEAKANVEWTRHFASSFMVSAFASRYISSPKVVLYADVDNRHIATSMSNMRGLKSGVPEIAVYGDIEFSMSGWRARAALHYCGSRSVAPSFVRRSHRVLNQAFAEENREELLSQQHLRDVVGIDLNISKWFNFERMTLGIQLSVRNLLGNNYISSGYEQNRVRRTTIINGAELEPFANRISYGYPRLFYLGITLRI